MHKRNVPDVGWVYEIMNIWKSYTGNNVNCRVKNYLKDDHRSYIRNLLVSSYEKKPWKKIQATCSPGKEGKAWKIWQSATLVSHEVKGLNPVQAWIFLQAFFSQLHKLRI